MLTGVISVKVISDEGIHFVAVHAFSSCLFTVLDGLVSSAEDKALGFEAHGDVRTLEVFVLHHKLEGWPEKTSFEFINVMTEFVIVMRDI